MDPPHKKGAGGVGEARRINVVYFLSRGGRTDHSHLFRVNHHSRADGVRLRDVERWPSEIRGKDMPDEFSWSYKRKDKAGYVRQDLNDDDLITPVSDNEYVLNGCDVRGTPPRGCVQAPKTPSLDEKKRDNKGEKKTCGDHQTDRSVDEVVLTPDSDESSPKPLAADQDSPRSSELSARCGTVLFKIEVPRPSQDLHQGRSQRRQEPAVKAAVARAGARPAPEEQELQGAGIRSHAVADKARRMRVARALHSILTCGAADADDAALRTVARRQRRSAAEAGGDDWQPPTPTCPGMDGCGLRVSRKATLRRSGIEKQGKRDGGKRDGGDAQKPAALPRCSQCGKEFKPQELHSHMQSCRGFKERMRRSSTVSRVSVDRSRNYSAARTAESRSKHGNCSREQPSSASAVFLLTGS